MQIVGLDGRITLAPATEGLSATFFNAATVNTTGIAALGANSSRKLGVWIQSDTASLNALVGDAISTAVLRVGGSTAATMRPTFIAGQGAIWVKSASGLINVSGYWI